MVESVSLSSGVAFRVNTHLSSPNTDFCMPLYPPSPHTLPGLLDVHPTTCRWTVKNSLEIIRDFLFTSSQEGTEKITVVFGDSLDARLLRKSTVNLKDLSCLNSAGSGNLTPELFIWLRHHHLLGNLRIKTDNCGREAHASCMPRDFLRRRNFRGQQLFHFTTRLSKCQPP